MAASPCLLHVAVAGISTEAAGCTSFCTAVCPTVSGPRREAMLCLRRHLQASFSGIRLQHDHRHKTQALRIRCNGCHAEGLLLKMEDRCASQHLIISVADAPKPLLGKPSSSTARAPVDNCCTAQLGDASQQQQQQQQRPGGTLQCGLSVECLVISVWDDERRRLLGGGHRSSRPAELCRLYLDRLAVSANRALAPGACLLACCLLSRACPVHS